MKNIICSLIVATTVLSSCSSQKNLVNTAPFEIGQGFCQEWIGGKEASGRGLMVKIPVSEIEGYKINTLFFRGQQSYVKIETEAGQKFVVANLEQQSSRAPQDMIVHGDAKEEFGNKPSKNGIKEKLAFPFTLEADEAVLSYIKKNTIKYVKVVGVKEKPALIYSSKPRE